MKASIIICLFMVLFGCAKKPEGKVFNLGLAIAEKAYYEGQKDAIEGRVRIKKTDRGNYVWIESPWDSGREPSFHPPIHTASKEMVDAKVLEQYDYK